MTEERTSTEEVSVTETTQGTDTQTVSSVVMIPVTDLDALRSVKDKEVSTWKKKFEDLQVASQTQQRQLDVEVDRRTTAETVASDAQRLVNLRNRARGLASQFFQSYGQDVGRLAEDKFLQAENEQHLMGLYNEFIHGTIPNFLSGGDKEKEVETRKKDALSETVGITSAALGPSTVTKRDKSGLAAIPDWIEKARFDRLWKNSSEGAARLKQARDILIGLGYPQDALPRRTNWGSIQSAYQTLNRFVGGTGESRKTKI